MQAYIYDNDRFYVGEMTCQLDPLESQKQGKDIYLTPANSTSTQPTIIEGAKPRWDGKAWEQYPDDKIVYGYTLNDDGTINYYGSNHLAEELQRIHKDVPLSFSDTEPVSVDGIYWLSDADLAYVEAKKAHEKAEALAKLDADYASQKQELVNQYTDDMLHGDSEAVETDKKAMAELDTWYDNEYSKLGGVE